MSACQLQITLQEGPVVIPSIRQAGVDGRSQLWSGITASEFFPSGTDSAFYVLALRKSVSDADQVAAAERDLMAALRMLAAAWPFGGGSFMALDSRDTVVSSRFETNASAVRDQLLAQVGKKTVGASAVVAYESSATYRQPPLALASAIAKAMYSDPALRRLLHYHQDAWMGYYRASRSDRASWFIDLYKVRELLKKLHGNEWKAIARLNVPESDWKYLGRLLNNNDLRHAELTDAVPDLPRSEVDKLFGVARQMVVGQLQVAGLVVA